MAHPNEVMTRMAINQAVREMWLLLATALDELGTDFLTDDDADVWGAVTKHPGVQDRLKLKD